MVGPTRVNQGRRREEWLACWIAHCIANARGDERTRDTRLPPDASEATPLRTAVLDGEGLAVEGDL